MKICKVCKKEFKGTSNCQVYCTKECFNIHYKIGIVPKIDEIEGEIWKDVVGYEGFYQVSSYGRVKSLDRYVLGKNENIYLIRSILKKQGRTKLGYCVICLNKNGISKTFWVHRLVAAAFIPNTENKPCVNHINNTPSVNHVSNLEWVTHKENTQHMLLTNKSRKVLMGEDSKSSKLTDIQVDEIRIHYSNGISSRKLGKLYNVHQATILHIKNRSTWKHI